MKKFDKLTIREFLALKEISDKIPYVDWHTFGLRYAYENRYIVLTTILGHEYAVFMDPETEEIYACRVAEDEYIPITLDKNEYRAVCKYLWKNGLEG